MSDSVVSPNSAASKPPGHDIFCTPENSDFVSKVPYQSLSKADHEIRLLKILPNSGSGFVECELLPAVSLATVHNQYLALSYCAGSAKNTKPIKVNGVNSNVFANLHHALTSARHYWETHAELPEFLLWVDQICINQFDLAERSHQVGFMRDIYYNAKRTLICLSTQETDGEGMRWLADMKDMVALETIDRLDKFIIEKAETEDFAKGMASFLYIAASPWWGRAWVFQEFMVSKHATFLYGRHSMPYSDFSEIVSGSCSANKLAMFYNHPKSRLRRQLRQQFEKSPNIIELLLRSSNKMENMLEAKLEKHTPTHLESLLLYTRNFQASDTRDKIYSVLGLASSGYAIMPDYSTENDIPKLLVETTRRIIEFDDSLSILSYYNTFHGIMYGEDLPSWVINWISGKIHPLTPIGDHGRKPKMSYFTDHKITAGSIDASFTAIPHPGKPRKLTTVLQAWAIFLDTGFDAPGNLRNSGASEGFYDGLYEVFYEGYQHYKIQTQYPVTSDTELWILCGAREPFLLSRYSHGYRICAKVLCVNLPVREGATECPEFMDDQGVYDTNKMDWKKITIF